MKKVLAVSLIAVVAVALVGCDKYGDEYIIFNVKTGEVTNKSNEKNVDDATSFMYSMQKNCTENRLNEIKEKDAMKMDDLVVKDCQGITYVIEDFKAMFR